MMMSLANGVIMRKSEGRIVFYRPVATECNVDISNKDSPSWKKQIAKRRVVFIAIARRI